MRSDGAQLSDKKNVSGAAESEGDKGMADWRIFRRFALLPQVLLLILACAAAGHAQGIFMGSSGGPVLVNTPGGMRFGGLITITVDLANAAGNVCTATPANIFSDAALTVVKLNPFTTDFQGNWGFYVGPGQNYCYTVSGTGVSAQTFFFNVPSFVNNVVVVDGATYPFTAAGVQAAIAKAASLGAGGGQNMVVHIAPTPNGINLGTTSITMNGSVNVECDGLATGVFDFSGTGSTGAFDWPLGTNAAQLIGCKVELLNSSGTSSCFTFEGSTSQPTQSNAIFNAACATEQPNGTHQGIVLTSGGAGAALGIVGNTFRDILFGGNAGTIQIPLKSNGDSSNHFDNLIYNGTNSSGPTPFTGSFQQDWLNLTMHAEGSTGVVMLTLGANAQGNVVTLTCDLSVTDKCYNPTGGNSAGGNVVTVSDLNLTPMGTPLGTDDVTFCTYNVSLIGVCIRQQTVFLANNVVVVDGVNYPYTAAGVQAAITKAVALGAGGGQNMVVHVAPAPNGIALGTTSITMNSSVNLECDGIATAVFDFSGTGSTGAFDWPLGTSASQLMGCKVQLFNTSGTSSCFTLEGSTGSPSFSNAIFNSVCSSEQSTGTHQGIVLTSGGPGSAGGIFGNTFRDIIFGGTAGTIQIPLKSNGDTGNHFENLVYNGTNSSGATPFTGSFEEDWLDLKMHAEGSTGVAMLTLGANAQGDIVNLLCDLSATDTCLNEVGGNSAGGNFITIADANLTPLGTRLASSTVNFATYNAALAGISENFLPMPIAVGAQPVFTGTGPCSTFSTQLGGAWNGSIKCTGTSGAATITITFGTTPGITAPNGWNCDAQDLTTTADTILPTGYTTTSCSLSAAAIASGDLIKFKAFAF